MIFFIDNNEKSMTNSLNIHTTFCAAHVYTSLIFTFLLLSCLYNLNDKTGRFLNTLSSYSKLNKDQLKQRDHKFIFHKYKNHISKPKNTHINLNSVHNFGRKEEEEEGEECKLKKTHVVITILTSHHVPKRITTSNSQVQSSSNHARTAHNTVYTAPNIKL